MTAFPLNREQHDLASGGIGCGRRDRAAVACSVPSFLSGCFSSSLAARTGGRLTSSSRPSTYFLGRGLVLQASPRPFDKRPQLRRNPLSRLAHVRVLSCSASSSAETKARKAFHDDGKEAHESGQLSQERSHV